VFIDARSGKMIHPPRYRTLEDAQREQTFAMQRVVHHGDLLDYWEHMLQDVDDQVYRFERAPPKGGK